MKMMDSPLTFLVSITLLILLSPSANAQKSPPAPAIAMPPAPAPAPAYANLTHLLSVAGPFKTFLGYCLSTKVIDTFQNQANNTHQGITLLVPSDSAFSALKKDAFTKLSQDQLRQVMLQYALQRFYTLSDFKNLSSSGAVPTYSSESLHITDDKGAVGITSGSVETSITSSVYATKPVALYEITKVFLPQSVFGKDVPLAPAPAPAPKSSSDVADAGAPSSDKKGPSSSSKGTPDSKPSSASRSDGWGVWNRMVLAVSGVVVLFL